jgi:hypothetical protein
VSVNAETQQDYDQNGTAHRKPPANGAAIHGSEIVHLDKRADDRVSLDSVLPD